MGQFLCNSIKKLSQASSLGFVWEFMSLFINLKSIKQFAVHCLFLFTIHFGFISFIRHGGLLVRRFTVYHTSGVEGWSPVSEHISVLPIIWVYATPIQRHAPLNCSWRVKEIVPCTGLAVESSAMCPESLGIDSKLPNTLCKRIS